MLGRRSAVIASLTTGALALAALVPSAAATADPANDRHAPPPKAPTAVGYGGAVASVDAEASRVGLEVLRKGGNATDAAVATAAALGVTEPYSAGLGGGGFFVHYSARTGEVETIDGREKAPSAMPHDAFIDPETGEEYPFFPDMVTSGASVGVPGTPLTWHNALKKWGTKSLRQTLAPAARLARRGFVVDETFHQQTVDNAERFAAIDSTAELFLPGGSAPEVGSRFRNPDVAATYDMIGHQGVGAFYHGRLAGEIADAVTSPPKTGETDLPVPAGWVTTDDLAAYTAPEREPTRSTYRGLDVVGMAPPSSGGTSVGEALNILERYELDAMSPTEAYHHLIEASAISFADRGAYVGDADQVDVPVDALLDDTFAAERACGIDPAAAQPKPVAAGDVDDYDGVCDGEAGAGETARDTENLETTNLTVVDRWGDVVEYTLTIEQTGGSGITVPGRGFLLNNELTDFSTTYRADDPNRIEPNKRPRSSMSPTIVLGEGPDGEKQPILAVGSPGGSTIITTVLQILVERLARDRSLPEAMAAPRVSQRNVAKTDAEPAFIDAYAGPLESLGHSFASTAEIGAATAIGIGPDGLLTATAEPWRRGGGSALVVRPAG
ncbi:gamma-glutamyltranspeptidase/glutathione hydrolase [Nocardioides albertanoniae]|uniref:Glutathione hydrolase proenzyme n=1 Tax=Nocardioides albertanoniae TaxID=1175486 RepID=A0A543AAC6_9ACTN|nr:gamma-glutamyltransferase [Nocardioides albertanoniae]TQL69470.1 gamma-glutamyltranspeptidase/glutathione hydrolase [Nocardioides albertanoniae]